MVQLTHLLCQSECGISELTNIIHLDARDNDIIKDINHLLKLTYLVCTVLCGESNE